MSHDDNTLTNKLSPLIGTQLPEFIQSDHPVFSEFVKTYYQFLESAEVTFSEVNNYLIQETTSKNFVFDENGDNIVLEDSEAKFTVGETITGRDSGATAVVLVDDVDDNKRLFITSQTQFIIGEVVNGSLSNSSGTIQTYRANPVQNIQQLLELANIDSTINKFLDNFRDSFLDGVVDNLFYSRYWAQEKGVAPVPSPSNGIMEGGDASLEDLIKDTKRGVLVTRLWYIRAVDPQTLLYTGLTRDGTFFIENGKIKHPVKNFRFNESPIIMLNNLEELGQQVRVNGNLIPYMKIRDFTFTSLSDAV